MAGFDLEVGDIEVRVGQSLAIARDGGMAAHQRLEGDASLMVAGHRFLGPLGGTLEDSAVPQDLCQLGLIQVFRGIIVNQLIEHDHGSLIARQRFLGPVRAAPGHSELVFGSRISNR